MPAQGNRRIGPEQGLLQLRTGRQGIAAVAGHDLEIEVARWSGEVVLAEPVDHSTVEITIDTASLTVRAGHGGAKPLSDRDKREIAKITRRQLKVDQHPEARFVSTGVLARDDGAEVSGTLTLCGVDRPVDLFVKDLGNDHCRCTGRVKQSDYGIRPYSAMLGALKVADPVDIEIELDLSGGSE